MSEPSTTPLAEDSGGGTYFWYPAAIVVMVLWLLYVPLIIYLFREYLKYRHTMFIQKRKGAIMKIFIGVHMFQLVIAIPILAGFTNAWYSATNEDSIYWYNRFGNFLYYVGTQYCGYGSLCICVWRTYMIWWEYHESEALKNDAWIQYLTKRIKETSAWEGRIGIGGSRPSLVRLESAPDKTDLERVDSDLGGVPSERDWVFRYKKTWGNQWWIFRRLFVLWICEASLTWFLYCFSYPNVYLSTAWDSTQVYAFEYLLLILHVIVMWTFWIKTPAFYDVFKVRNEIRYMMIASSIGPAVYWISFFVSGMVPENVGYTVVVAIYYSQYFGLVMATVGYSVIRGKSLGYLTLLHREPSYSTENNSLVEAEKSATSPTSTISPRAKSGSTVTKKVRLRHILQHRKTLDLFAQHLVTEFSIECLLAVIEFSQFQMLLKNDAEFVKLLGPPKKDAQPKEEAEKKDKADDEESDMVPLPYAKLPRSYIVHGDIDMKEWIDRLETAQTTKFDEYKIRAYQLFERYINPTTAELEINISYQERKFLIALFNQETYWGKNAVTAEQLSGVWNNSVRAMLQLMNDAYSRFVLTDKFERVHKYFGNPETPRTFTVKNVLGAVVTAMTPRTKSTVEMESQHELHNTPETEAQTPKTFFADEK